MRFDRHGVSVHEDLEHVFAVELARTGGVAFIALVQRFADGLVFLARQFQAQPVVLDALAPQVAHFLFILRPGGLFAVDLVALVGGKVKLSFQQFTRIRHALVETLLVQVVDGKRRRQVFIDDGVVELGAQRGETVDVGLHEKQFFRVQGLEIAVEDFLRHGVVERHGLVMDARQDARGPQGGLRLLGQRLHGERRSGALVRLGCASVG